MGSQVTLLSHVKVALLSHVCVVLVSYIRGQAQGGLLIVCPIVGREQERSCCNTGVGRGAGVSNMSVFFNGVADPSTEWIVLGKARHRGRVCCRN